MVRVRSVKRIAGDQPLDCPSISPSLGGADKRTAGSRPDLFMSRLVGRLLAIGQAIAQLWNEPSAALRGSNEVSSPLIVIFVCFFIIKKTSIYMQFRRHGPTVGWVALGQPPDWSILRNGFVQFAEVFEAAICLGRP